MTALRVAWSLIRIPRLFATFLLFPLLISFLVLYGQLFLTGVFSQTMQQSATSTEQAIAVGDQNNFIRLILYGTGDRRPPIKVCRWLEKTVDGVRTEWYPDDECRPDRLDVALHVQDPSSYDPSSYQNVLDGNFERLHLCHTCSPDIVINPEQKPVEAHIRSIWALALLSVARVPSQAKEAHVQFLREMERVSSLVGKRVLHLPGATEAIPVNNFQSVIILVGNVAALVIISLWLSLKAHRKVLDYFSKSGALLPMVAACGRHTFYGAVWILTLSRVAAFLLAAIPVTVLELMELFRKDSIDVLVGTDVRRFLLWLLCLIVTLGLASVVASLADLKQRYDLLSFLYRYIPPAICFIGAFIWFATLLFEGPISQTLRSVITVMPVLGMAPVIVAPIFKPATSLLLLHGIFALILVILALRSNARWFAAHLEDL